MEIENLIKGLQILEPYCKKNTYNITADNDVINIQTFKDPSETDKTLLEELGFYESSYGKEFGWTVNT